MKRALAFILAVVMLFSLTACGSNEEKPVGSESNEEISAKRDTLNLCVPNALEVLDPGKTNNLNNKLIWYQIYEGLIYYNHEENKVEMRVAESYDVSEDGLKYTFKLRDDVFFHNGDPVTVEDVVFSFNRAKESAIYANHVAAIKDCYAAEDGSFVVEMNYPYAPFISSYVDEIFIMSEKFVTEHGDNIDDLECGTGPYMFDTVDRSVSVSAKAFDRYYRGEAAIKSITWNVITDTAAAAMALQAGNLDYLSVAWSQIETLGADPNLVVGTLPAYHTSYLAFNCKDPVFSDVRVRQGISYLLDVDEIALLAFEGYADADTLCMSPGLAGMPDVKDLGDVQYTKNVEKGLALLKEAGYDTSAGEVYLGKILTLPESHYLFKPAQVIQAQLEQYGIKVDLDSYENSTMYEKMFGGSYQMAVCGGSYGTDITGYATVHGSSAMGAIGGCCSYFYSDRLDELFDLSSKEQNMSARQEYGKEIMQIMFDNVPQVGVGHKQTKVAWNKNLNTVMRVDYPLFYEWSWNA